MRDIVYRETLNAERREEGECQTDHAENSPHCFTSNVLSSVLVSAKCNGWIKVVMDYPRDWRAGPVKVCQSWRDVRT